MIPVVRRMGMVVISVIVEVATKNNAWSQTHHLR